MKSHGVYGNHSFNKKLKMSEKTIKSLPDMRDSLDIYVYIHPSIYIYTYIRACIDGVMYKVIVDVNLKLMKQ